MLKFIIILSLVNLVLSQTMSNPETPCPGCFFASEGAEEVLNKSLSKQSGDGPYFKLVKINSAKQQFINGMKYVINADLRINFHMLKGCNFTIIVNSSPDIPTLVDVKCPGVVSAWTHWQ
ncbi:sarcocystatin-A-like [Haematobia irritans]|uniref:sarcocystatin-A-like n=1 Tax=Haematobia irritans TaxID=7368 RepID=UPI003F4F9111